MTTNTTFIKRHPILIYFILAFIISWGAILILAGPDGIPATQDKLMILGMAMLLGPSVGSMLMTGLVSGKAGFRDLVSRLLKWRVKFRWYAVALLVAPLSTSVVVLVLQIFSPVFTPAIFKANNIAVLLLAGITGGISVGIFEELGWTGFAILRMKPRYGISVTGIIIGLIWGAWHFLLFWENDSFSGFLPLILLIARLFSWLPAYRVIMVWVYEHTESLLIAIIMHMSLVASLTIIDPSLSGNYLVIFILARAAVLWIIATLIIVIRRQVILNT